jgi:hypothetical protein
MPIPVYAVGQELGAADVNNWLTPDVIVKPSDQSVTSSIVLVNDIDLVLALGASTRYLLTAFLVYEGGTQGSSDMKFSFTTPAGATLRYMAYCQTTAGAFAGAAVRAATSVISCGSTGAGNSLGVMISGTIAVSTTAGNLQLQWAQNSSSATATIMHQNSWLCLQRET